MYLFGRRFTGMDVAVAGIALLVLATAGYLGWSVYAHNRQLVESSPVSRNIADLRALVEQQPDNVVARLQLAQSLTVAGRDDEAIAEYRAVLDADQSNITALAGLGFIASQRKEWGTAEGYWKRVIEIREPLATAGKDTALETAYFYMGVVLAEQQRYEDAIPYYKAALRINRSASDSHYHLAYAYKQTGATTLYREELEITLAFDPSMPEANYALGQLLLEEGDIASAAEHFRVSTDKAPAISAPREALEQLGSADERLAKARELESSDASAALSEARVAIAIDPDMVDAQILVARLYEKAGDSESALTAWRRVVAIDGENAEAREAVKRLGGGS